MKITYIANIRIPTEKAHGYQIMKTAEALVDLGVDFELITPYRANRQLEAISPFDFYHLRNKFTITKINSFDPVFLMPAGHGLYIKLQTLFFLAGLWFYFLGKSKDQIFYTRDELLLPFLTSFSDQVVWEAHDLPKNRKPKYWQKCFRIITISNGLSQEIIRSGIMAEKVIVASDGVDLKLFDSVEGSKEDLRRKLLLPFDKKIVLYAGHLYPWKGADTLAQVAGSVGENTVLVFLGGTGQELVDFRGKYGRFKNIVFINQVDNRLVPQYMKAADILILPNSAKFEISKTYTSPLKLFEYMAAGRPIIASDLPSLREILNEQNCLFFKPDNSADLAEKIQFALKNYSQLEKLTQVASDQVKKITWDSRARRIINLISQ